MPLLCYPEICGPSGQADHWFKRSSMLESFGFSGYEALAKRFYNEVQELWRKEDEERCKGR